MPKKTRKQRFMAYGEKLRISKEEMTTTAEVLQAFQYVAKKGDKNLFYDLIIGVLAAGSNHQ